MHNADTAQFHQVTLYQDLPILYNILHETLKNMGRPGYKASTNLFVH